MNLTLKLDCELGLVRRRSIPKNRRKHIFKRDNYKCLKCGSTENLTIDHIVPICKGGDDRKKKNLQTLCENCNWAKGSDIADYRVKTYPRMFKWNDF